MTRLPPKLAWPLAVLATSFVAAAGLVVARPGVEEAPPIVVHPTVRVAPAETESVQLSVYTQGTVVPRTETDLVAEVSGRIVWVSPSLAAGGFVEPDEVLLRIEATDYEIGLARAQANLRRAKSERALAEADCTWEQADKIYRLTTLASMDERCIIPPFQREMAIEMMEDPHEHRASAGFGFRDAPRRS